MFGNSTVTIEYLFLLMSLVRTNNDWGKNLENFDYLKINICRGFVGILEINNELKGHVYDREKTFAKIFYFFY